MTSTRRKNIISAIITVLILASGILIFQAFSGMKESTVRSGLVKEERRQVSYDTFSPQVLPNSIEIDGRVRAHEVVDITSKVQGEMLETERAIREGRFFKKGDILFRIDQDEARYNLLAQKSSLLTSITQMMPDLKFDYPEAFEKWQAYLKDFEIEKPLEKMPEASTDQVKYYLSGRNIYNQFYTIKSAERRLKDYVIYAPFSGVITAVNVYPGALISPGTTLATMINTTYFEMESPIPLEALKYVQPGQNVELNSQDLEDRWTGRVNRIGTQLDPNTQNIPVYIGITGSGLKDGMYLQGELTGESLEDVVRLPKEIFVTPRNVYVIQDSTLITKELDMVKRTANHVLVRGLDTETMVVTGSLAGLYEGQKVNY